MSASCRVFIGRLSHRARESDVERFFRGFGKIREINLKNDYINRRQHLLPQLQDLISSLIDTPSMKIFLNYIGQ